MSVQPVPFFSGALYARKSCFVYLPSSYESTDREYPVVYLLHGMYGSESDWLLKGNAEATLNRMMQAGELGECIVVFPNDGGYGQGTFYIDWYDGTGNFEQYIVDDLVPFIDETFRTIKDKQYRYVGGLSMGGFGAFSLALRNPGVFGAAASLSGALGSLRLMPYPNFARSEFPRMFGPRHGERVQAHDQLLLTAALHASVDRPHLYFDCGKEDYLYEYNAAFNRHLDEIGYPHVYTEYLGEHNWAYWTEHLPDALRFFETCRIKAGL